VRYLLGENLANVLESTFVLKCLEDSCFLSQFSHLQKRAIIKAMKFQDLRSGDPVEEHASFLIVVNGMLHEKGESETLVLERGTLKETSEFSDVTARKRTTGRRQTRSGSVASSVASSEFFSKLSAGPSGARIATLDQDTLADVLMELGITHNNEEVMDHARRTLLAKKVPTFHHLTPQQTELIVQSLIFVTLQEGAMVCEAGIHTRDLWIVVRGEVEEVDEQGTHLRTIGQGGHFGSLLSEVGCPHAVRVYSPEVELWQLERGIFEQVVTGNCREELTLRFQRSDGSVELKDLRHVAMIGQGTFGTVRLVEHVRLRVRYALKRVKKKSKKVTDLVERECELLAELDHPLVLQLVKMFDRPNSVYILTEYCSGGELLDALDAIGRVLRKWEAQFYAGSILLVLEELRDRHIVFRDLKPENVMLDAQGYVKLIDFGTAKKLSADSNFRTFTVIGSWQFMAPEVLKGRGYGTEVDLWSLGVMLFEFVMGYLPFSHGLREASDICEAITKQNLVFPEFYTDHAGKSLIRNLLRKEPDRRLGSDGYEYIQGHEYFKVETKDQNDGSNVTTLFDKILGRQLQAPYTPSGGDPRTEEELLSDAEELAAPGSPRRQRSRW